MKNLHFMTLALVMLSGIALGLLAGNWSNDALTVLGILTAISGCLAFGGFTYDLVMRQKKTSIFACSMLGFFAVALLTAMLNQNVLPSAAV